MKISRIVFILFLSMLLSGCFESENENNRYTNPAAQVDANLPNHAFTDLEGNAGNLTDYKGKVVVINFWATWCPPCKEEMPVFIDFQNEHTTDKVQFIGFAIDQEMMVRDFVDVFGINFPTIIGDLEPMRLAREWGNRFDTLPFTAIFDREGKLVHAYSGAFTKKMLEDQILPLF